MTKAIKKQVETQQNQHDGDSLQAQFTCKILRVFYGILRQITPPVIYGFIIPGILYHLPGKVLVFPGI